MNRKILFLIALFLLLFLFLNPMPYKQVTDEIVTQFLTFYIPALFPSIFFINTLLKSGYIQDLAKRKPGVANCILLITILFGGTPALLSLKDDIEINDDNLLSAILITPSFSYIFFIFSKYIGYLALLLGLCIIVLKFLVLIFFKKEIKILVDKKVESTFELVNRAAKDSLGSIFNLAVVILSVNMLTPLLNLLISVEDAVLAINGVIEYSFFTPKIFQIDGYMQIVGAFVLEFNGLCSILAFKKAYKKTNLLKLIPLKIVLSLIFCALDIFLFKFFNNTFWN